MKFMNYPINGNWDLSNEALATCIVEPSLALVEVNDYHTKHVFYVIHNCLWSMINPIIF
jgi:hypothetical protein